MTKCVQIGAGACAVGLALGCAVGWKLARSVPDGPGRLLTVSRVPSYEPVSLVPDTVAWPTGPSVKVQTVLPPGNSERRELDQEFGLATDRTHLLGRFDLPAMPDGGKAVAVVPKGGNEPGPLPVSIRVRPNRPPLLRVRWEPEASFWYGFGSGGEFTADSGSYAMYIGLGDLVCIRDRVCLTGRAGRESRPWGEGWVAEIGVSATF